MADTVYLKDQLSGFVPTPIAQDIIADVTRGSSVMRLSKVEMMESDNKKFPVMVNGPGAYWVGEGKRIQTGGANWIFPEIQAKKLAVIIPVTREKIEDATLDIFGVLRTYIAEAFYRKIDEACIFGKDSPFAKNIVDVATAGGMAVTEGTNDKLDQDISDVMALVEAKGRDVNGFVAGISFKNRLRKLRDADGNQLYVQGVDQESLYARSVEFVRNGAWDDGKALCIGANWDYSIIGIRDQIEYVMLREATLQNTLDEDGKPLSLAEQDMVGIRATMRLGFLPVKEEAFALLVPAAAAASGSTSGQEQPGD